MAHYRNITVAGKNYRYNVGSKFTEIRDGNDEKFIHENRVIGNPHVDKKRFIVTPLNVQHAILGRPVPELRCEEHGTRTIYFATNPFVAEIEGHESYMINCAECIDRAAGEI